MGNSTLKKNKSLKNNPKKVMEHPDYQSALSVYISSDFEDGAYENESSDFLFEFSHCGHCPLLHVTIHKKPRDRARGGMYTPILFGCFDDSKLSTEAVLSPRTT